MEVDAERLLNNLHVIAALTPFDKLITNGDRFDIHAPSRLREVYRTWQGEKRGNNMFCVRQTLRSCYHCINTLIEPPHNATDGNPAATLRLHKMAILHVRLCQALSAACVGMENLLQTYKDDATMSGQIEISITEARDFLTIIGTHTDAMKKIVSPGHFKLPEQEQHG